MDAFLVFLLTAALIWPLFKIKYLANWASIESTFIADARFLRDHWPHPGWQPNWYCGTRTDYVYPPMLRYGTAALARYVPNLLPVRAYHLYVAFFYCFGIAGVFLLARTCSESRVLAWLAALAVALVSPSYLFVSSIRHDTPLHMPYRLNVLLRYGEGPHMTALAWIAFVLLFSFLAMKRWHPAATAGAAVASAAVVSNNFYGATSLAILFPTLLWSVYITHLDARVLIRALAIPALAWGLTAFWLVPSYLQITLNNMQFVSTTGNMWSRWVALGTVIAFVIFSDHFARGRKDLAWITFLSGALALFAISVLGNHFLDFRIIGEPSRLFPELDMLIVLWAAEVLRRLWTVRGRWMIPLRAGSAFTAAVLLGTSWRYVVHAHSVYVPDPKPEERVEFQLQDWMAKNMPGSRAVPAGSVRFWYNVWNDLPQLGGGSEQGLLNPKVMPPQWEIALATEGELSVLWMQVFAVDAIIVNNKDSREIYHDYINPEKFRGLLPVVHDNGAGDTIYGVPRRFPGIARIVDRAQFDALPVIPGNGEKPQLQAWYDAVERGPNARVDLRWEGTDTYHLRARTAEGQSIHVAESFDSNWIATESGRKLPMRQDKLGMTVIDAAAGDHDIRVHFSVPFSNRVGRVLTALSLAAVAGLVWIGRGRR